MTAEPITREIAVEIVEGFFGEDWDKVQGEWSAGWLIDEITAALDSERSRKEGEWRPIAEANALLKPFALAADYYDDSGYPDINWPTSEGADDIRLGHLRAARAFLNRMEMNMPATMKPSDLPPPDTIIEYPSGARTTLMFHYATEEIPFADIAAAHGFEVTFATLDEDDPLFAEYEAGEDITAKWKPEIPAGWQFGSVEDTEDGPIAVFIRPEIPLPPIQQGE